MEIIEKEANGATVLEIVGKLDAVTSSDLDDKFDELAEKKTAKTALNFERLDYISSAGLRSLLAYLKKAKANDATLKIFGIKGPIKEIFDISGFTKLFEIHETEEEALK